MFLNSYHQSKNKEIYVLTLLILFSIFIRVPVVFLYGDAGLENEWRILVNNLINHGILAFDYHDANLAEFLFPNLYMPPLYAYYIYFFSFCRIFTDNSCPSKFSIFAISLTLLDKLSKLFFISLI